MSVGAVRVRFGPGRWFERAGEFRERPAERRAEPLCPNIAVQRPLPDQALHELQQVSNAACSAGSPTARTTRAAGCGREVEVLA